MQLRNNKVLELRGIALELGGNRILSGVDWCIERGQHWAVLGANGSGKTSLLRIVTGYLWPSGGRAKVLGKAFGQVDLRQLRRRIGLVSSALGQMIRRSQTARQIVLSGAFASTGLFDSAAPDQQARADELLSLLGCCRLAERHYETLSLGEQQRVLIARALMPEPDLLLIDEPCAGLDLPGREILLETIDKLAGSNGRTTLVMVSHHIEEITRRFTHVLILKAGKVMAAGPKPLTLTDANLQAAFELNVELDCRHGRYWPRVPHGEL